MVDNQKIEHEFHYWEDDPSQVQILPSANRNYCEREFAKIREHARAHKSPDGVGWTKMYELGKDADSLADTRSLKSLALSESRFVELMAPHSRQFDKLVSPLSEFDKELGIRSVGFGPCASAGVVADLEEGIVCAIWCRAYVAELEHKTEMANLLVTLNTDNELFLVDWSNLVVVNLRSREEVEVYLEFS